MNDIGLNLKKIRLLKKMTLKDAAIKLNMSPTAIAKYEKSIIIPDSTKLIQFASAYQVKTIDLLNVYNEPELKFDCFRKKQRLKGQNLELLKTIIKEEVAKNLEVLQLKSINLNNDFKKQKCETLDDAEKTAINFRNSINMSNKQPLQNIIATLENINTLIIQIKNHNELFNDFDGLSEIVNNIPIIVILDNIKDGARQRFTIAHELGHLIINCDKDKQEKLCNRFASSILMPKEAIINEFGSKRKNINFFELTAFKKEYKVSYKAIIYRLHELGIISEYLYKSLLIQCSKYIGKEDKNPIKPETTYNFKKLIYHLQADDIISINKACELLNISKNEFNEQNYFN